VDHVARTPAQLGPILKSCRMERGLTQRNTGARVGLKQSTVSQMETRAERSSIESLYKLLSALNLELVIRDKDTGNVASGARTPKW
jgi:HTH-type transcriptional regulator/antitoxin HipB